MSCFIDFSFGIIPSDPEAQINWGLALMLRNRFDEAIPHFERACELDPTSNAHLMFGRALAEQRRPQDAAAHFRAALKLDPESNEAHQNLALVLRALGQADEADQHFRKAQDLGSH